MESSEDSKGFVGKEGEGSPVSGTQSSVVHSSRHITALDGVRGIAILSVMLHHFFGSQDKSSTLERYLINLSEVGWVGVDLFFALSGFLITGILLDKGRTLQELKRFYIRRTLRIFPLYYLSLGIVFFLLPYLVQVSYDYSGRTQWWYWTYLTNILFVLPGDTLYPVPHFWSLAVEEQFYLIWPLLLLCLSRRRDHYLLCVGAILLAPLLRTGFIFGGLDPSAPYVLTVSRMDTLVWGGLVATVVRDPVMCGVLRRRGTVLLIAGVIVFVVVCFIQGSFRRGPLMMTVGFSSLGLIFAAAIGKLASGDYRRLAAVLGRPFFTFFGKYSYGMYVIHPLIITALLHHTGSVEGVQSFLGFTGIPKILVFTGVASMITISLSLFVWNVFEKQFLKLKEKFS